MSHRSYWIQAGKRKIDARVVHILIATSVAVSIIVFCAITIFVVAGQATPSLVKRDEIEALVKPKHAPIGEILRKMFKPLKPLGRPLLAAKEKRKGAKKSLKEPVQDGLQPIKLESLIVHPEPASLIPSLEPTATQTPTLAELLADDDLPNLEDQPHSTAVHGPEDAFDNNYSLFDDDAFDESLLADDLAAPAPLPESATQTSSEIVRSSIDTDEGISTVNRGLPTKETVVPTQTPEISTAPQKRLDTTNAPQLTYSKALKDILGRSRQIKETKESPSLDKIAERIFEKFKNHDDIPSYEDLWYDDAGDLFLSEEVSPGRNVKRQVDYSKIVRPAPLPSMPPKNELETIHQVTDTIDKFRMMLDLAQQVEYYITRRLRAGVNVLSAFYEEDPLHKTRR